MRASFKGRTYDWEPPLAPTTIVTVNGGLRIGFASIARNVELAAVLTTFAEGGGFNPGQARVPKGNDNGGEWIDTVNGLVSGLNDAAGGKSAKGGENNLGEGESKTGGRGGPTGDGGYEAPPDKYLDDIAAHKDDPGKPQAAGTVDDPIYCGDDLDRAMDLLGEGKHVRIDGDDDDVAVLVDKLATEAKGTSMDICKVSVDDNLFCAGSAGRPRVTMPQFASKNPVPGSIAEKNMVNGEADMSKEFRLDLKARGVGTKTERRPADHYLPAQSEMLASKSAGISKAIAAGKPMPGTVFVSRDGYVIDGHHRWAAVNLNTAQGIGDGMMDVEIVDMDISDILLYANEWTEGMGLPHADILGKPVGSQAAKDADKRKAARAIAFARRWGRWATRVYPR